MFKYLVSIVLCSLVMTAKAQTISYELRMPNPQNHYFVVTMILENFSEEELALKMPVWTPGSYLVRDFSRHVNQVKVKGDGISLPVNKSSKNTWKIQKGKAKRLVIDYEVYAFELTVRTSFLDQTHGFVSGAGVFMFVDGHEGSSGTVEIFPHAAFSKITTALPKQTEGVTKDGSTVFTFANYDVLVDSPIEIGNQEVFTFTAAGVNHEVAIYGPGNHDVKILQKDMARIVEAATAVFGQNPNKNYTFIIHNVVDGQGGLEHANSTVLSVNRWTYAGSQYLGFLSLVAHEYFHLWNVKRLRPFELGPFNYDEENYTTLLWVMEGFTSYYDELLLLRAGFYTKDQLLEKVLSSINYVEGTPGSRVQPLAHASYDAWIKAYKPNENSKNTTMTYYSRGAVMASIFDAMIVAKYKGQKSLDDFMRQLYDTYYVKADRGFTEAEFKKDLEGFLQQDLTDFFARYIHGTDIPDYRTIFAPVGVSLNYVGNNKPDFGATYRDEGGRTMVSYVRTGSAAELAGISVGDELIGVNMFRVNKEDLDSFLANAGPGTPIELVFSREDRLYVTEVRLTAYEQARFSYRISTDKSNEKAFNYWLRTL